LTIVYNELDDETKKILDSLNSANVVLRVLIDNSEFLKNLAISEMKLCKEYEKAGFSPRESIDLLKTHIMSLK